MSPYPWLCPSTCIGLLGGACSPGVGLQRANASRAGGGKRGVAPGPRRGFPAALGPFREAGLPEAARRPRLCQGRGAQARTSGRPLGGGASAGRALSR